MEPPARLVEAAAAVMQSTAKLAQTATATTTDKTLRKREKNKKKRQKQRDKARAVRKDALTSKGEGGEGKEAEFIVVDVLGVPLQHQLKELLGVEDVAPLLEV